MQNEIRKTEKKPNKLIDEKSPYLLQHAFNPVDWYPWGSQALEKAKLEDKPIFLSIGYASCHWCHVMEKECFDDEEVAALLNSAFVCIKVDREERPDLDAAYMAVCQAMGKNCGWPLNIMMTPKMNPFFATSYIPKSTSYGVVGMVELIPQVTELWRTRRRELEILGVDIRSRIEDAEKRSIQNALEKEVLDEAFEELERQFDSQNGGFGIAPKFPRPHSLMFLLRYWKRTGEEESLSMVQKTLRQMRLGGIFDQVGFGFHRYSTDAEWLVPHFEKMLYDQALMALAYVEAYQVTGAEKFKLTARETLDYVLQELSALEGGFYSAQDADTDGEEGKYYVWTFQEVREAVGIEDAELAARLFGVELEGNYNEAGRGRNGKNILHFSKPAEQIASDVGLTLDELIMRLGRIRNRLFVARKRRQAPAKDDKILTDWNGLAIAALAKAANVFNEQPLLQAAERAANFILDNMRQEDGSLFHRYSKGEKAFEGFLDDYAFLTWGLLELYEVTFNDIYLRTATNLNERMIERFWDTQNGGFYNSPGKTETSMPRMKQLYDGALPSGNSVALLNLLKLSRLTNNSKLENMAEKTLRFFAGEVQASPDAYTFSLVALDFALGPSYSVVVVGDLQKSDTQEMLRIFRKEYLPNLTLSLIHPGQTGLGYEQLEGQVTAYVCRGKTCMPPTNNLAKMLDLLDIRRETKR